MQRLRRKEKINRSVKKHYVALLEKNEEVTIMTEHTTREETMKRNRAALTSLIGAHPYCETWICHDFANSFEECIFCQVNGAQT